jgi:hypothetical protein
MFLKYIKECLVPTLRAGDIVVMDNLSSHKVDGVEIAFLNRLSMVFRPVWSTD